MLVCAVFVFVFVMMMFWCDGDSPIHAHGPSSSVRVCCVRVRVNLGSHGSLSVPSCSWSSKKTSSHGSLHVPSCSWSSKKKRVHVGRCVSLHAHGPPTRARWCRVRVRCSYGLLPTPPCSWSGPIVRQPPFHPPVNFCPSCRLADMHVTHRSTHPLHLYIIN